MKAQASEIYEIKDIFGSRLVGGKIEYHVKWKGYPDPDEDTREPLKNIKGRGDSRSDAALRKFQGKEAGTNKKRNNNKKKN